MSHYSDCDFECCANEPCLVPTPPSFDNNLTTPWNVARSGLAWAGFVAVLIGGIAVKVLS